jgi:hypothetical protein
MTGDLRSYAAGFIDGEGSISIIRNKAKIPGYIVLSVSQKSREILDLFKEIWGGTVNSDGRTGFQWHLTANEAMAFLKKIKHLLIIKRAQVDIAIQFQKEKKRFSHLGSNQYQKKWFPVRELNKRENFKIALKQTRINPKNITWEISNA